MAPQNLQTQPAVPDRQPARWWAAATVVCSVGLGTLLGVFSGSSGVTAATGGLAAGVVPSAIAVWLVRHHRSVVSRADQITLVRVALTGMLSAALVLVITGDLAARSWLLAGLAGAALALDAVDGWVARRTRSATPQGAAFDSEADAALLLMLTGLAAATLGWWVLAIGLMRYTFLAASWVAPALRSPLAGSRARRIIGGSQGLAMLAVLTPAVPVTAAWAVATVALASLMFSFIRDIFGQLRQHRLMGPRRVAPDWLRQRRGADHRAREQAVDLVDALNTHLRPMITAHEVVTVVDVGAGTGSNMAWLAPRLHCAQRWILVDPDPQVLSAGEEPEELDRLQETVHHVGDVTDLPAVIRGLGIGKSPLIVTCSALLDVLSFGEAQALSKAICGTAANNATAALLSLNVTGEVGFSPPHRHDQAITEAFNSHQRRAGLLGPDAVAAIVPMLQQLGGLTTLRSTDWRLGPSEATMLRRYICERAEAATAHDPLLAPAARTWTADRLGQLTAKQLRVQVGHVDLLYLPPANPAA